VKGWHWWALAAVAVAGVAYYASREHERSAQGDAPRTVTI